MSPVILAFGFGLFAAEALRFSPATRLASLTDSSYAASFYTEAKPNSPWPLTIDNVSFGVVEPGGKRAAVIWVQNTSAEPHIIAAAKSTCPCVEFRLEVESVPAKSKVPAFVRYDDSREPGFAGLLSVGLRLVNPEGVDIGQSNVTLEVTRDSDVVKLLERSIHTTPVQY